MARVVVVGLGPAGPELLTAAARAAIARIPVRFVRTRRHPAAVALPVATASFDDVYERAADFDEVYRTIAEALVAAAEREGEVLYAVPGSPTVLERSVAHLRAAGRVKVELVAGLSFLDLAWARLGVDPLDAGVRLVDGHRFPTEAGGERGPLLVAHCHNRRVLSDIKLAVDDEPAEPVVVLQRLGLPDEAVFPVAWAELDRSFEPDHLTSLWIPRLAAPVGAELVRFVEVVRALRERCPWDREQTHASLARYALEEAYELVDAIGALDRADVEPSEADAHLAEELGDVLLQVVLHAAIAAQEGRFTMADVAAGITEKMVRRHPHVFGDTTVDSAAAVAANWEAIKAAERNGAAAGSGSPAATARTTASVLDGVHGSLPALAYADALFRRAAKVGFDWPDIDSQWPKLDEELGELREAIAGRDPARITDEYGDVLAVLVNLAHFLRVDPEVALRQAATKFRTRFQAVERLAAQRGLDLPSAGLPALDALWDEVKSRP